MPVPEDKREGRKNLVVDPASWWKALDFVGARQAAAGGRLLKLEDERRALLKERDRLLADVQALNRGGFSDRVVDVVAIVDLARAGAELELEYFVPGARWKPAYDLHFASARGQIRVETAAAVEQATGEDWTDVTLLLSTAIPGRGIDLPELLTWTLGERSEFVPQLRARRAPPTEPPLPVPPLPAAAARAAVAEMIRTRLTLAVGAGADRDGDGIAVQRRRLPRQPGGPRRVRRSRRLPRRRAPRRAAAPGAGALARLPGADRIWHGEGDARPVRRAGDGAAPPTRGCHGRGSFRRHGGAGERAGQPPLAPRKAVRERNAHDVRTARARRHAGAVAGSGAVRSVPARGQRAAASTTSTSAPTKATVPSSGKQVRIPLASQTFRATAFHEATPALATTAFLRARVRNDGKRPLLRGPATIFGDGELVGLGEIKTTGPGGDIEFPLGADQDVRLVRQIVPTTKTTGRHHQDPTRPPTTSRSRSATTRSRR